MILVPNKIIIHHSATKDSGTVSWNAIRRYHVETNKWKDIGYHAGVELITDAAGFTSAEILYGRDWDQAGAHTVGQNEKALGLCVVGDFDLISPSDKILNKAAQIVAFWCRRYKIGVNEIYGHRDFANKTCPGKLFDLGKFRDILFHRFNIPASYAQQSFAKP